MDLAEFTVYCAEAHRGQYRKGGQVPYFTHCLRVMNKLIFDGVKCEWLLMAAVGHDLLEDTDYPLPANTHAFVQHWIQQLTKPKTGYDVVQYFKNMEIPALLMKVADACDNLEDSLEYLKQCNDPKKIRNALNKYKQYYELMTDKLLNIPRKYRHWVPYVERQLKEFKSLLEELDYDQS